MSHQHSEVFEEWSLYDKIIHHNYMRHREISSAIESYTRNLPGPLRVLDLGCGDGSMALQGLRYSDVSTYVGIDLSTGALNEARMNLSQLSCSVTLRQSSLEEALTHDLEPTPNLVLASYSLHHFQHEAVVDLVDRLGKILESGGYFFWIDLQRSEQESRDEYLRRFFQHQLQKWTALNDDEIEEVVDHMSAADFPLAESEKQRITESAGFKPLANLFQDADYAADVYTLGTKK